MEASLVKIHRKRYKKILPFLSDETIVQLIGATTTQKGLKVIAKKPIQYMKKESK